ncbi:MAG TPA: PaaI family thioesterase [Candidatus Sulfotelmatobacter sp.]|nr:PaaI family thioesterase [Candidatus Sulfotelmatobacter sp.]
MSLLEAIAEARRTGDADRFVASIPYFRFLGLKLQASGDSVICVLPEDAKLIGNPLLPALHGGVVGALLEAACIAQLIWRSDSLTVPKTINITVDYLRSARPVETYALANVTRQGRRVANVRVEAWQDDKSKPVAAAHAHFLLQ